MTEGKVVHFFESLEIPGDRFCINCGNPMRKHGILDGINGEENVCPGDYIVTDRQKGYFYRMPAGEFESMYEPTRPVPTPHD